MRRSKVPFWLCGKNMKLAIHGKRKRLRRRINWRRSSNIRRGQNPPNLDYKLKLPMVTNIQVRTSFQGHARDHRQGYETPEWTRIAKVLTKESEAHYSLAIASDWTNSENTCPICRKPITGHMECLPSAG